MEENFSDFWNFLGREIAGFGFRWIIVGSAMLILGGFFGKRYRSLKKGHVDLKKENCDLKKEQHDLKKEQRDLQRDLGRHEDKIASLEARLAVPERPSPAIQSGGSVSIKIDNSTSTTINEAPQSDVESFSEPEIQVMHYGTKYGDLRVEFFSVEQASEDIQRWLAKHDLRAGVSADAFRTVLKRIQSNRE